MASIYDVDLPTPLFALKCLFSPSLTCTRFLTRTTLAEARHKLGARPCIMPCECEMHSDWETSSRTQRAHWGVKVWIAESSNLRKELFIEVFVEARESKQGWNMREKAKRRIGYLCLYTDAEVVVMGWGMIMGTGEGERDGKTVLLQRHVKAIFDPQFSIWNENKWERNIRRVRDHMLKW